MLVVAWFTAWKLLRNRAAVAAAASVLLYTLAGMSFSGWVATLAGWYVTEIGRQPWIVYGMLKTADAVARIQRTGMADRDLAGRCIWLLYAAAAGGLRTSAVFQYMARKGTPPAHGEAAAAACRSHRHHSGARHMTWQTFLAIAVHGLSMGLALMIYVVLDGYDLGVGILAAARRADAAEGHRMVASDRPVLGCQRNLAGAGHRRAAGGVSQGARRGARVRCTCRWR